VVLVKLNILVLLAYLGFARFDFVLTCQPKYIRLSPPADWCHCRLCLRPL